MQGHLLPNPTLLELALNKALNGFAKPREAWRIFPSGEVRVRVVISEIVSAGVIGRTHPADGLFATALLSDTLRGLGSDVTAIIPYLGYARQDRPDVNGDSVGLETVIKILVASGVRRLISIDAHNLDALYETGLPTFVGSVFPDMADRDRKMFRGPVAVVSPDQGGFERARSYAMALGGHSGLGWVQKTRHEKGHVTSSGISGVVSGKVAVIVDDQVDTGGTILEATRVLREYGFTEIHLRAAHPVLSGKAVATLKKARLASISFSDTIPLRSEAKKLPKLSVVSALPALLRVLTP